MIERPPTRLDDPLTSSVLRHGGDPALLEVLEQVCGLTGMGFAAVARVTEERWIACQVLDRIGFGLKPGDELAVATTICDDIRRSGCHVIIDHVREDQDWRTHPTPILYGFQSYASLPIRLADGSFYGTLCAIDPEPALLNEANKVQELHRLADRAAALLPPT